MRSTMSDTRIVKVIGNMKIILLFRVYFWIMILGELLVVVDNFFVSIYTRHF